MQTAAGLAAAHAQGLVHRDVKPANILLENGVERVKLTDFGLARAVADASMTQSGVVAGTPQYMAPEQARAEATDHRADLFSLGSVLYAMCTGIPPFRAETPVAVLRRVTDDEPRPIRELNPESPPGSRRSSSGSTPRTRPSGSPRPPSWPTCSAGAWPTSSSRWPMAAVGTDPGEAQAGASRRNPPFGSRRRPSSPCPWPWGSPSPTGCGGCRGPSPTGQPAPRPSPRPPPNPAPCRSSARLRRHDRRDRRPVPRGLGSGPEIEADLHRPADPPAPDRVSAMVHDLADRAGRLERELAPGRGPAPTVPAVPLAPIPMNPTGDDR